MKNKTLGVVIIILLIIVVGGATYLILGGKIDFKSLTAPLGSSEEPLSEQPNIAKFNEYFSEASLVKFPAGKQLDPFGVTKTKIFTSADQFCISLNIIKTIPSGSLGLAVYDVNAKTYTSPKSAFPMELKSGDTVGCEDLDFPAGKYEQKVYIDDILAVVLPFEVK